MLNKAFLIKISLLSKFPWPHLWNASCMHH